MFGPSTRVLPPQFGLVWAVVWYNQQTVVTANNPVLTIKGAHSLPNGDGDSPAERQRP